MDFSLFDSGNFFTDLAAERREAMPNACGVDFKKSRERGFLWERIKITNEKGEAEIGRPIGRYDTLITERADRISGEGIFDAAEEVARELCLLFENKKIIPERILVIGLGNEALTPDSLGAKCVSKINATMQLPKSAREDISEIAVFAPGVSSKCGIESVEAVIAICERIMPDAVIAIDALTARSPLRLGCTVQFSDTGIYPGSGVGRVKRGLNLMTLGVPVISVGMPTVVSAEAFCREGGCGDFSSMLVAPREIDLIVERASDIISLGINQAFGIALI